MHKTLLRQIDHLGLEPDSLTPEWKKLLDVISETYSDFDRDHVLIERSLEISSAELKNLVVILQTSIDSISEGIIALDEKRMVTVWNKRFIEIWQVPENIMVTHDPEQILRVVLDKVSDPKTFKDRIEEGFVNPQKNATHTVEFTDGRTIEFQSKPQMLDGKSVGTVWSSKDITMHLKNQDEFKARLEALEHLNKAMVDRELKMVELKEKIKTLESGPTTTSSTV